jgi:ribose transport system substrate-binding protein
MKSKKIIMDIVIISFAFLFFILWHQKFIVKPAQETFSNIGHYKVYLITTDKEYEYWNILNQGAAEMASMMGVNYIWDAPAKRNTKLQIDVINNAVNNGANALIVAADDPKQISSVIEDAKAKSVKVIYVDSPAYEEAITTLATDNYEAGVQAGLAMLSILDSMGITSGSIGIVNYASKANTELRERGFRDTLAKDTRFRILDTIYTASGEPEEAQAAAEQMIQENQDLVALFGTNEGVSIGIGNAIKENDNRYIGVGFDQTEAMMQLLNNGNLKAIIAQNPYTMGYLGVAEAVAALLGKDTGPDYINTGVSVISNY